MIDDQGFAQRARARETGVRVGVGGWNFAPWRNNFYPAGLVQKRELEFASRHLTAIEINSTFYSAQKPATYARWRSETPDGFVFSLKAPGHITGRRLLAETGKAIAAFVFGGLAELGDRLGPIVWQLPPNKAFERADLAGFLDQLPRSIDAYPLRHALEVRHESFRCAEFVELARTQHVSTVFADSDEHPSFADATGEFIYARLMRSEAAVPTGYPATALTEWAKRARAWAAGSEPADLPRVLPAPKSRQKPREVFVYFIGAAKQRNPAAAMALIERIER
ncbi:MAG: DUF72 domain-containing protein [Rudaea sp.]